MFTTGAQHFVETLWCAMMESCITRTLQNCIACKENQVTFTTRDNNVTTECSYSTETGSDQVSRGWNVDGRGFPADRSETTHRMTSARRRFSRDIYQSLRPGIRKSVVTFIQLNSVHSFLLSPGSPLTGFNCIFTLSPSLRLLSYMRNTL